MKKITSAALLAIQLTWMAALVFSLTAVGLQIFDVYRELMPGGVPLQATFGFDENSRVADPLFRDPENGDFTLSENSPALALGFRPIDLTNVGHKE